MKMQGWISMFMSCFLLAVNLQETHTHSENVKLLLVSFDGFRWDYLDIVKEKGRLTPNFDLLIANGVKAKYGTKNVFVTKTFPNHYSLATGMYEENHGVVGNEMYDPRTGEYFNKADPKVATDPKWWNNGTTGEDQGPEPIWVTNQKGSQHVFERRSGVMFWPGSEVEIRGMRPHHWIPYDNNYPNKSRVDNIVKWFSSEEDPINLGLLYFSEPDHLGHNFGPDSPQMFDMIVALDGIVGYLIDQLKAHDLFDHMNIIITSDHGMAQIADDHVIDLSHYIDPELFDIHAGNSPGINVIPKKGKEDHVYDILSKVPHMTVYKKEDIPASAHYTHNYRVLDILVIADVGYDVYVNATVSAWGQNVSEQLPKGNHGYNNSDQIMHPFFIAHGPAFKQNFVTTELFNSVDVYPLICEILDLKPGPCDGSLDNIKHILVGEEHSLLDITMITSVKEESAKTNSNRTPKVLLTVMLAATVAGIFCVAACRVYRITKHRKRQLVLPLNLIDGQTHLLATDDEEIP